MDWTMKVDDIYKYKRFGGFSLVKILSVGDSVGFQSLSNGKKYKRKKYLFEKEFELVNMDLMSKKLIKIENFEFTTDVHCDAGGIGIRFQCPICTDKITWAPYARWGLECECRKWSVDFVIIGEKLNE